MRGSYRVLDGAAFAAFGSSEHLAVTEHKRDPSDAEGCKPLGRGRARAERGRPAQQVLLKGDFVVIYQCVEQAGSVLEPAEHRALADTGGVGHRLHGQPLHALVLHDLPGGIEEQCAVARSIGSLTRGGVMEGECRRRLGHL